MCKKAQSQKLFFLLLFQIIKVCPSCFQHLKGLSIDKCVGGHEVCRHCFTIAAEEAVRAKIPHLCPVNLCKYGPRVRKKKGLEGTPQGQKLHPVGSEFTPQPRLKIYPLGQD